MKVENQIRASSIVKPVTVLAGQLWRSPMDLLPRANEPHQVASHCWIIFGHNDGPEEAYLFPQSVNAADEIGMFRVSPSDLRSKISDKWLEAQ